MDLEALFRESLGLLPPWLLLAGLLGVINAAACFLLFGRRIPHLAWYVMLGNLAGSIGQVVALTVNVPAPLLIGELNVLAVSACTWAVLASARVAGL